MTFAFIEIHSLNKESNKEEDFAKVEVICVISFFYLQTAGARSSVYACVGIHLVMNLR